MPRKIYAQDSCQELRDNKGCNTVKCKVGNGNRKYRQLLIMAKLRITVGGDGWDRCFHPQYEKQIVQELHCYTFFRNLYHSDICREE